MRKTLGKSRFLAALVAIMLFLQMNMSVAAVEAPYICAMRYTGPQDQVGVYLEFASWEEAAASGNFDIGSQGELAGAPGVEIVDCRSTDPTEEPTNPRGIDALIAALIAILIQILASFGR